MIKGIIYLLGLCTLTMILTIVVLVLCLSNVQWGKYAQKGQELAKAKIAEAVNSTLEEAVGGAGSAARPEAPPPPPPPGPEAGESSRQAEPGRVEPAAETASRRRYHWVQKGETLFAISSRYYADGGKWSEIARANHIEDPSRLRPGMRLEIP